MQLLARLRSGRRLLIVLALLGVAVFLVGVALLFFSSGTTTAASEQPIKFNHKAHAENGIPCQFCHSSVQKSPSAGIPSVSLCMGCHQYVATESEEIQKLAGYWERQEPVPWERVHELPSYVQFNHAAHIAGNVGCGSCHGDVANMTTAEQVVEMTMGFCLDCHKEQENKEVLRDCVTCHY